MTSHEQGTIFSLQTQWITDTEGRIIVDFVGRFETLDDDVEAVARLTGRQAQLPHLKPSKRGHYRQHYGEESRETIARIFEEDCVRFGYRY